MRPLGHETDAPAPPSHQEIPQGRLEERQIALDAFHARVEGRMERTPEEADELRLQILDMREGRPAQAMAARRLRAQVAWVAMRRLQIEN